MRESWFSGPEYIPLGLVVVVVRRRVHASFLELLLLIVVGCERAYNLFCFEEVKKIAFKHVSSERAVGYSVPCVA